MSLGFGDFQWLREIKVEQGSAGTLVFAAERIKRTIRIKPDRGGRKWLFGVEIPLVPPGNKMRDVQVLGAHEEFCFGGIPMHMRFAAPPSFVGQRSDAFEANEEIRGLMAAQSEGARRPGEFRPALDAVGISPVRHRQRKPTVANEVARPEWQAGRLLRFPLLVKQLHPCRNRLLTQSQDDLKATLSRLDLPEKDHQQGACAGRQADISNSNAVQKDEYLPNKKVMNASGHAGTGI